MARRKTIVGISILGHAALLTGVFFHSAWDLDQLGNEARSRATVAALAPPAASEIGSVDLPKVSLQRKEQPKTPVTEPRQPTPKHEDPPAIATGPTGGDGTTGGGRIGPGDTDGPCRPEDGPCDTTPQVTPPAPPELPKPPPVPPKPPIVPPQILKGLRTSGETAIHPPRDVYQQMARDRELKTSGVLKVCITETGAISSVSVLKSTGYATYDAALVDGARGWRYRPYTANGVPVPVCSSVTFQYQMR